VPSPAKPRIPTALTILIVISVLGMGMAQPPPFPASSPAHPEKPTPDWAAILGEARGQTVYWNAWGGDERVNAYIAWAGREAQARFGVEVRHVKLSDTAEAVARVLAEKAAGRQDRGSVDLLWINGENFAAMKANGLLFGPFTQSLPNFRFVDTNSRPTLIDFTLPVDGLEAPWSVAQLVFHYDRAQVPQPPASTAELLDWAKANPGRFTYPQPPDFLGTTFLKQVLVEHAPDRTPLYQPADESRFDELSAPLWRYLDELHPALWRRGRTFPASGPAMLRQLGDGELDMVFSFGPETASSMMARGQLPDTVRSWVPRGGSLGNASFLAIPFNSRSKAGAQVLVNFLLSPEAQARKQDPRHLGALHVLDLSRLSQAERNRFADLPRGPATPTAEELGSPIPELHPTWMDRLESEWQRRYGAGP